MRNRLNPSRAAAIVACAASLAGGAAAFAPAAGAAVKAQNCGSRAITIPQKTGKSLKVPVSRIRVEGGATCRQAIVVIRGSLTKNPPAGWAYGRGNFKVPRGLTPQIATKGHMKVKWATPGPS